MKRNPLILAYIGLSAIIFSSCKKETSNSSSASAIKLLTSSRWTFQKYEYYEKGAWTADPYAADEANFTAGFNANGTFSLDDTDDSYTETGTWSLSSNNTVLTTTGGGIEVMAGVYNVALLNSTTLQITNANYPNFGPQRITFTR